MKNVIKILLFLSFLATPYLCLASSTTTDNFLYFKNEIEKIRENQTRNYDRLNTIDKEKIPDLDNKLSDYSSEKVSIGNLINSVASEQRAANEKENAYDKAINQSKLLIIGFGTFITIIVTVLLSIFGFMKNKELTKIDKEFNDWKNIKEQEVDCQLNKIKKEKEDLFGKEGIEKIKNEIGNNVKDSFLVGEMAKIEAKIKGEIIEEIVGEMCKSKNESENCFLKEIKDFKKLELEEEKDMF